MITGRQPRGRRSRLMRERWGGGTMAMRRYKGRLAGLIRPGMSILHAGCGWDKHGVTLPYRESCSIIGIDLDPRVSSMFHSEFHLGSIDDMPFENGSFDVIACEWVVEHLENPRSAFREMHRVLKPGGRIVILTPNLYSYKALAAALTPYRFHIFAGRIRYGRGREADMYPTRYRCNTARRMRRVAGDAGLHITKMEFITTGPTWLATVPIAFEVFDAFHRIIERWEVFRQLRCAMIVELSDQAPAASRDRHDTGSG